MTFGGYSQSNISVEVKKIAAHRPCTQYKTALQQGVVVDKTSCFTHIHDRDTIYNPVSIESNDDCIWWCVISLFFLNDVQNSVPKR